MILNKSILVSSLIKDSATRQILLLFFMKFYLPEYALEEIEALEIKISRLSGLSVLENEDETLTKFSRKSKLHPPATNGKNGHH
jgi:hypothetical protein